MKKSVNRVLFALLMSHGIFKLIRIRIGFNTPPFNLICRRDDSHCHHPCRDNKGKGGSHALVCEQIIMVPNNDNAV